MITAILELYKWRWHYKSVSKEKFLINGKYTLEYIRVIASNNIANSTFGTIIKTKEMSTWDGYWAQKETNWSREFVWQIKLVYKKTLGARKRSHENRALGTSTWQCFPRYIAKRPHVGKQHNLDLNWWFIIVIDPKVSLKLNGSHKSIHRNTHLHTCKYHCHFSKLTELLNTRACGGKLISKEGWYLENMRESRNRGLERLCFQGKSQLIYSGHESSNCPVYHRVPAASNFITSSHRR
jgi:hypothetical protein